MQSDITRISNLILQWAYISESNNINEYKYFPIVFPNLFLGGFVSTNQMQEYAVGIAWINNQDFSLSQYRVGIGNDWVNGYIQKIFVLLIGM